MSDNRSDRCLEILHEGLFNKSDFWVNVHAAEALLHHAYSEGIREKFVIQADTAEPKQRIGIWRVLERVDEKNTVSYQNYLHLILEDFLGHESPDHLHALETLGKLGYAERLPEIVHCAENGNSKIQGYARRIVANAGDEKDKKFLAELLSSKIENYEICGAIGIRGDIADVNILEKLLEDPDNDIQVCSANALLRIERRQNTGLHLFDWIVIVFYAVAMITVGFYYARRTKTGDDYLLGGRKTNSIAAGISLMATMVSAIAFLGTTGETIKHGPAFAIFYIVAYPINYFVIGYIIIPLYMKYRFTSAYELLEKPLGRNVRIFASILFISVRFLWMSFLIYLSSKAIITMLNWDTNLIPVISITMGLITLIYSTMGGFRAVVVTDVSQAFLLFLGAALTVIFITVKLHGVSAWLPTEWAPNWDKIVLFSFDPHIRLTGFAYILTTTLWWICTLGSDQMAVQRFVSTKDVRAARKAYLSSIYADFFVMISLVLVGMALLKYYVLNPHLIPDGINFVKDTDFLFPHYIVNYLPVGLTGLVIAGFLSAAMSSLSSGINSSSAVLMSDILPIFRKLKLGNFSEINRARFMSLIVGVLAVALSSVMNKVPGNVFEITAKTSNLFVASLFNLFFMAMFIPFATPVGTITGTLYGSTAAILIAFWDMLTGKPGLSFTWILPGSLFVCVFTSLIFSLLTIQVKKKSTRIFCYIIFLIPLILITALLITLNRG